MNCGCTPQFFKPFQKLSQEKKIKFQNTIIDFLQNLSANLDLDIKIKRKQHLQVADKIFFNGIIYTMEEENATAQAIAICRDKIIFVGSLFQANLLKNQNTQYIDLKGKTMFPGFIEPHVHLELQSLRKLVDLSGFLFDHEDQIKLKIVQTVKNSKEDWVTFQLYDPMITPGDMPHSRWDLDQISKEKAIFILQANGHVAHVNSKAFELAGIDKDGIKTPDPAFGRFVRDQQGYLTGQLQQTAIYLFAKYVVKITYEQYQKFALELIDRISSKGITTVHDCGVGNINPVMEMNFISRNFGQKCKIRLSGMYVSTKWAEWEKLNIKPEFQSPQVRLNGVKCWVDGSTQAGSAFLTSPYLKSEWGFGHANYKQQTLDKVVLDAHNKGFRVGIHSNGDAAIDMSLNAFQKVRQTKIHPQFRLRIQHSTVCRQDQLQRMYQLGVTPSFLIGHVYFYGVAFRDQILGIKRASKIDPLKSAFKHQLKPTIHSDYNCQPISPMRCIHNAVTRILKYGPQQRITVYQGLQTMTTNAAWQCHMDDIVGSLTVGKMADFVVLDQNPFLDPLGIINIKVLQTWKGGVLRFQQKQT